MRAWILGMASVSFVLAGCGGAVGPGTNGQNDGGEDAASEASALDAAPDAPPPSSVDAGAPVDSAAPVVVSAVDASAPLRITRDVTVDGLASDRFTWTDAHGTSRSAVLAHNDGGSGAGGSQGGELRELDYIADANGTARAVHAPPSSFGGFGYVVGHRSEGTTGLGNQDDSPLGHFFPGTWTRIFEGANHAIFRFTQTYPRYSRTDATPASTRYDVPVTIDWVFTSGHDDPLWSITYDLTSVPANAVDSDSRAPYGEMLFDGSASLASHSTIAGVGWGDRYKFTTAGGPVTLGSAWTWDQPNTVPYVEIWTGAVDAAMGIVQTQTLAEHEAGGYWGINRWDTTSAKGLGCTVATGGIDSSMPCAYNWPYQSIQYALYDTSTPTNDPRLAWGTEFGFLGQTAYDANGSAYYGGPDTNRNVSGWPKQSYSTYIVMGAKSRDPVGTNVSAVEAMQTVTTTASAGTVATSGPAGINRADTMTYAPAGYDPIYGALTYVAANNALDATVSVGTGALSHPLVIVRNWTGGIPSVLKLDGAVMKSVSGAFISERTDAKELWITWMSDLRGTGHRIQISGPDLQL